jgi:PKD repeat protein
MKLTRILMVAFALIAPGCTAPVAPDPGSDNGNPTGGGPIATFTVTKTALRAKFDASGVSSPGYAADALQVRWDFTNDGTFDTEWAAAKTASFTYPQDGSYTAVLQVKDPQNRTDSATKTFNIAATNTAPTAVFNVNIVKGMTASLDASSSNDSEDAPEDVRIRWDFDGDGTYDTDWVNAKTAEYTYPAAGEYTIKLQVKDLNEATKTATQTIIASPITIRSCFITYGSPYKIGLHFRMLNNVTGQIVTPADVPALTRAHFTISEENIPIDVAETNQILYSGKRPMFMVLVLDFTGSMYDAGAVVPMMDAAKAFIASQGDTTYVSLWAFWERDGGNGQIDDYTPCSVAGKAKLQADLDTFAAACHDRGATQIWDLLKTVLDAKFPIYDTGVNRAIAFLSDGHDTASTTTLSSLIDAAHKKATSIFSVGMAFRPQEYPADEPNLKKIAEDTGGLYFTVNQVGDLSTVFTQLSEDVSADWTLSYITLKSTGTHTVTTVCNYLDGYATMTGKFPVTADIRGDIKQGVLYAVPALDSPAGKTEYTLYASYIPRNISTFKVKVTSASPVALTLYDADAICKPVDGWTISPNVAGGEPAPADGWYTLSSITPLEFGSWGKLAKCTVEATGSPAVHFELPAPVDQTTLYGDKTMVFAPSGGVTLDVP